MHDRYAGRDTPNVSAAEYCRVMFLKDSSEEVMHYESVCIDVVSAKQ